VTGGPIALPLHALLGTLLLMTGIAAVVRATLARRGVLIGVAVLAFVAILVAWVAGTKFVGDMSDGASLLMALATAVAILCYASLLFIAPASGRAQGQESLPCGDRAAAIRAELEAIAEVVTPVEVPRCVVFSRGFWS
jgi:hypothetical protein